MATAVLDLEESLKEYLNSVQVLSEMREMEFTNLLEGIKKGDYQHLEEVLEDMKRGKNLFRISVVANGNLNSTQGGKGGRKEKEGRICSG